MSIAGYNKAASPSIAARISDIFSWCGGATVQLVNDFPEERSRLAAIGATVCFTGIFATASSAYALFMVFGGGPWVPALALLWGAMIFNLDRFIVMTIHGDPFRRLLTAIPRLILATVIALVVARPLELWIFSPEIKQALSLAKTEARRAATATWNDSVRAAQSHYEGAILTTRSAAGVVEAQTALDATLAAASDCKKVDLQKATDRYVAELEGRGGPTGPGKGTIAREKETLLRDVQQRCEAINAASEKARATLDSALGRQSEALKYHSQVRNQEIAKADQVLIDQHTAGSTRVDSLLSRHSQLTKLASEQPAVKSMTLFITALFWLVEVLPVLSKLMAGNSIYDAMVAERLDAVLEVRSGSKEAAAEQRAAGQDMAILRTKAMRAEAEAAAAARKEGIDLHYKAIGDVIHATRAAWQLPTREVDAALARMTDLSRMALADAHAAVSGNIRSDAPSLATSARVQVLHKPSHRARTLVLSALITCGVALSAVYATFVLLHRSGAFAKSDLAIAIGVGTLVVTLLTVRPFPKLLSRLSEPDIGSAE
jgi:hypothetical protein